MTRAQSIALNTLRNAGWHGMTLPTGPEFPQGAPLVLINSAAEIVYVLPSGHVAYVREPVRRCHEAINAGQKEAKALVHIFDVANIVKLLNVTSRTL